MFLSRLPWKYVSTFNSFREKCRNVRFGRPLPSHNVTHVLRTLYRLLCRRQRTVTRILLHYNRCLKINALIVVEIRTTVSMYTKRKCRLTVDVQNQKSRLQIAFKTEIDLDRKMLATVMFGTSQSACKFHYPRNAASRIPNVSTTCLIYVSKDNTTVKYVSHTSWKCIARKNWIMPRSLA